MYSRTARDLLAARHASGLARIYTSKRSEGFGVKHALEIARIEHLHNTTYPEWLDPDFRYNGLRVEVTIKPDTDPMLTGKWCEDGWDNAHSNGDYIKNPDAHGQRDRRGSVFAWYKPMTPVLEHFRALVKDCKMGSALAYEKAWQYAREDMEREKENNTVYCFVELTDDAGKEWGSASCGGIDDEDFARFDVAFELMSEAFHDAVKAGYKLPTPPRPMPVKRAVRVLEV